MILVQNCRMIDPASQTDSLRDILIGEDRITKIAEAGTIDPAQITKEKEDELRILNADGRGWWIPMCISVIRVQNIRKIS